MTDEVTDRRLIRELIDAYAHCADRRDAKGQMALFSEDTVFEVYMDARVAEPTYVITGREGLAPVFDALNQYQATTHFNGQSTIRFEDGEASGETYCIAHHLSEKDGQRMMMLASIRYLDRFQKRHDQWLFVERKLLVDWTETRSSNP